MKKTALTILAVATFCFVFVSRAHAQTLTFDRAYRDYQFNLTVYNQAYSDYQDAKNAYLANQTLALKETARQKTYTMLTDRDQLMLVYLTALRTKIVELPGLGSDDRSGIFGKIDSEVGYYSTHKSGYHSDDTLEQLFATASQPKSQYKNTTSLVIQEALFDISLGQVQGLRIDHEQVFSTLKSVIDAGVAAGTLKIDPFNRWLTDIDTTDQLLKSNESAGKTQIVLIYNQAYSSTSEYDTAVETLTTSVKPLSQFNEFLNEVLNYIKSHQ